PQPRSARSWCSPTLSGGERAGNFRFAPGRRQPTPGAPLRFSVLVVLRRLELALAGPARLGLAAARLGLLALVRVVAGLGLLGRFRLGARGCGACLLGLVRRALARDVEPLELGREDVLLRAPPLLVIRVAGAGGDQPADDHVLLEAAEVVTHTADGRLGQHAGRLLERRGRDERL